MSLVISVHGLGFGGVVGPEGTGTGPCRRLRMKSGKSGEGKNSGREKGRG